ncbi:MAG: hypothetical protein JW737_07300 [Acidobacteria bacterium]|nr:hypothetical protein [Acidobacteriota bacterium]
MREKIKRYFLKERIYIVVSVFLLIITTITLKLSPVKEIKLELSDSAYLNLIEQESRVSTLRPGSEWNGFPVFKRVFFHFPYICKTEKIDAGFWAYTIGKGFFYQVFYGEEKIGKVFIQSYGGFRRSIPVEKNDHNWNGKRLNIGLHDPLKSWQRPRMYLRGINILPKDRGYFLRTWEIILPIIGFVLIFQILFAIIWKSSAVLKTGFSIFTALIFTGIGLFWQTGAYILQTIFLPVILTLLVAAGGLMLYNRLKKALSTRETAVILLILTISLTFWLGITFYPTHYHPDAKTHIKWSVKAEQTSTGDFITEYSYFQMQALLFIQAPFPYSPSFYLAVKALSPSPAATLFWVRFLPVLLTVLSGLLIYIGVRRVVASESNAPIYATIIYLFNGIMVLRILYYFYPALWGYFFITGAILLLLYRSSRYSEKLRFFQVLPEILLITIGFIAYPSGPFALGMIFLSFIAVWFIMERKYSVIINNWFKIFIPAILFANLTYYLWYIPDIINKVLPAMKNMSTAGNGNNGSVTVFERLGGILGSEVLFLIALIGFILLIRKLEEKNTKYILLSWGVSWLFLFAAGLLPSTRALFKFGKDSLLLMPLFAISLGYLVDLLLRKKTGYRIVAIFILIFCMVGFGVKLAMMFSRVFI